MSLLGTFEEDAEDAHQLHNDAYQLATAAAPMSAEDAEDARAKKAVEDWSDRFNNLRQAVRMIIRPQVMRTRSKGNTTPLSDSE